MLCNNCRIGISRPAKITKTICQRAGITKKRFETEHEIDEELSCLTRIYHASTVQEATPIFVQVNIQQLLHTRCQLNIHVL